MSDDNMWVLASHTTSRTRQPSFSTTTQTLYSTSGFGWNTEKSEFVFGHMDSYARRWRWGSWKAGCQCPIPTAARILTLLCTNEQVKSKLLADWYDQEERCARFLTKDSIILMIRTAHKLSTEMPYYHCTGPNSHLRIWYYNHENRATCITLGAKLGQSLSHRLEGMKSTEIIASLRGDK